MRIIIDQDGLSPESDVGQGFAQIKSLTFAPETGMLGQSAAVNEFTAEIVTAEGIETGGYCRLRDDMETLWAEYWVTSARRVDQQTVRVKAQSDLMLLDRPTLPAEFYDGVRVSEIVAEIFNAIGFTVSGSMYTLDSGIAARTLTGFCPEQTARERLQWVCFAAGAYIKSCFCRHIEILPVALSDGLGTLIPSDQTFWKPRLTEGEYVTAVTVKAYRFTQAEPQSGDQYVTDSGGTTYVYTAEEITIENPELQPSEFPVNVVAADDVMLLDTARASAAASLLAQYYFARTTVELDVIDNGGTYQPGMKVTVYGGEESLYTGYITACSFRCGLQSRATLTVAAAEQIESAKLTVLSRSDGRIIDTRRYSFPVGYGYQLTNDYIDEMWSGVRRIYRPLSDSVSGTMISGGATVTVDYAVALELCAGILDIISVDGVTEDTDDEVTVEVIA